MLIPAQLSVFIGCVLVHRKTDGMRKLSLSRMRCSGQCDTSSIKATFGTRGQGVTTFRPVLKHMHFGNRRLGRNLHRSQIKSLTIRQATTDHLFNLHNRSIHFLSTVISYLQSLISNHDRSQEVSPLLQPFFSPSGLKKAASPTSSSYRLVCRIPV
jgi:hypothetical protein